MDFNMSGPGVHSTNRTELEGKPTANAGKHATGGKCAETRD